MRSAKPAQGLAWSQFPLAPAVGPSRPMKAALLAVAPIPIRYRRSPGRAPHRSAVAVVIPPRPPSVIPVVVAVPPAGTHYSRLRHCCRWAAPLPPSAHRRYYSRGVGHVLGVPFPQRWAQVRHGSALFRVRESRHRMLAIIGRSTPAFFSPFNPPCPVFASAFASTTAWMRRCSLRTA